MSKYLDELGPEANLGNLFEDLYERASKFVGSGTDLALPSSLLDGTDFDHKVISSSPRRLRHKDGYMISILGHPDPDGPKGFKTRQLVSRGDRITTSYGRDAHVPQEVGAFEPGGIGPDFSIRRHTEEVILLEQFSEADVPGEDRKLEPGTTQGNTEQTLGSLDAVDLDRAAVVSSAILRNLQAVEFIIQGSTVEEAFTRVNEQTGV